MTAQYQPINWDERFVTGTDEMDQQHMILIHTLNEAGGELARNAGSSQLLERITKDLLAYALYHFDTEEELMRQYTYAENNGEWQTRHLAEHRSFSAKVVAVRESLQAGASVSADDVLQFLKSWLINHILNTDAHLGRFVAAKRASTGEARSLA